MELRVGCREDVKTKSWGGKKRKYRTRNTTPTPKEKPQDLVQTEEGHRECSAGSEGTGGKVLPGEERVALPPKPIEMDTNT